MENDNAEHIILSEQDTHLQFAGSREQAYAMARHLALRHGMVFRVFRYVGEVEAVVTIEGNGGL